MVLPFIAASKNLFSDHRIPEKWQNLLFAAVLGGLTIAGIANVSREISQERRYDDLNTFLNAEAGKFEKPYIIPYKIDAERFKYYLDLPVYDDKRIEFIKLEADMGQWDRDAIFFICRDRDINEVTKTMELPLKKILTDKKAKYNVLLWKNPLWKKRKSWNKNELSVQKADGKIIEDFETPEIFSKEKSWWLKELFKRGLTIPEQGLTIGKGLLPHHGHGWVSCSGVSIRLTEPNDKWHISGKHSLKVSLPAGRSGGRMLTGKIDYRPGTKGKLFFTGEVGSRIEISLWNNGKQTILARCAVPETGKIYCTEWEMPGHTGKNSLLSIYFMTGTVAIDCLEI